MKVYVVTGYDLGWDCIVDVFNASEVTKEALQKEFPADRYYISEQTVQNQVD